MTPVQAAIQRGDVVPRAVYETQRQGANETIRQLRAEAWVGWRLAGYLLAIVNAGEMADADTLAQADAALERRAA